MKRWHVHFRSCERAASFCLLQYEVCLDLTSPTTSYVRLPTQSKYPSLSEPAKSSIKQSSSKPHEILHFHYKYI